MAGRGEPILKQEAVRKILTQEKEKIFSLYDELRNLSENKYASELRKYIFEQTEKEFSSGTKLSSPADYNSFFKMFFNEVNRRDKYDETIISGFRSIIKNKPDFEPVNQLTDFAYNKDVVLSFDEIIKLGNPRHGLDTLASKLSSRQEYTDEETEILEEKNRHRMIVLYKLYKYHDAPIEDVILYPELMERMGL
jgi:hypothetical protein